MPTTLTQLYTWVMLVFSNQWHHTEESGLNLDTHTSTFLKGCEDTWQTYESLQFISCQVCEAVLPPGPVRQHQEAGGA